MTTIAAVVHAEASYRAALDRGHYLGSRGARARLVWEDSHGVIVFSGVSARRLPNTWIELSRWCIVPGGVGSQQWAACLVGCDFGDATTIVSYSDPSVGHTGALYRACNWIWAPVWHVLREPPTGAGLRGGKRQRAKHRWVYLLRPDSAREEILRVKDSSIVRRWPWADYKEPTWRRGVPDLRPSAGRYKQWAALQNGSLTFDKKADP